MQGGEGGLRAGHLSLPETRGEDAPNSLLVAQGLFPPSSAGGCKPLRKDPFAPKRAELEVFQCQGPSRPGSGSQVRTPLGTDPWQTPDPLPWAGPGKEVESDDNAKRQKDCLFKCLHKTWALEHFCFVLFCFQRRSLCGCTGSRIPFKAWLSSHMEEHPREGWFLQSPSQGEEGLVCGPGEHEFFP